MKVKIIATGEIVEAKRFKDLTRNEAKYSVRNPNTWEENMIFIHHDEEDKNAWDYMFDEEVEIIEE